MKVKAWGTRGSIAISNPESVNVGGNTTCYEVISDCFPKGDHIMLDAGTGFVPAGWSYLGEINDKLRYVIFFTHYHWDHLMGLTLAPPTFIDSVEMKLYGPVDQGLGPKEVVEYLFKRPFFPVDAKRVSHKMHFEKLQDFDVSVIVVHPHGGYRTFSRDNYTKLIQNKRQISLNGKSYDIAECMVISMQAANHGNAVCISYRFDENPTGKSFVFCTDHEDEVAVPLEMKRHFQNADLLIMDGQYNQTRYMSNTGRFGHGTPHGIIKQAIVSGAKKVGITHHDPRSTDPTLKEVILEEALKVLDSLKKSQEFLKTHNVDQIWLDSKQVFICSDYLEIEV